MEQVLPSGLYGITAEEYSRGRSNLEVVSRLIEAGVKIIQYREKNKKMQKKYEEAMEIRNLTKQARVTFIVNDHVDLAQIVNADGVHLGQQDLPVPEVRKILGEDKIIGLSTHSPDQARQAVRLPLDYIGVGPLFSTNTKEDVCPAVGLEYLEFVKNEIDLPFVAIGGIKEHNIELVSKKGAECIALVTEIVGAEDIVEKVATLSTKM